MEWIQHHKGTQLIRNDSITTTTNTTVASVLHVSISSIENGSYFTCITFFKSYDGPVQTTASNIPDIRFIWNSTKIILQESTTSSTAKYVDGTRIRMATALIDGKGSNSASDNYWCKDYFQQLFWNKLNYTTRNYSMWCNSKAIGTLTEPVPILDDGGWLR